MTEGIPAVMRAVRLHPPGGPTRLVVEQMATPRLAAGEALVRVHAAAITRDELSWPTDRLPAIPSYEFSGVVAAVASDVEVPPVGTAVYALGDFDRDGAAADYTVVPAGVLAPKPATLGHLESAAVPLAALSAWQALFDHGRLREGQRVLVHGGAGGVGGFAVQLARWRGAQVAATASTGRVAAARRLGADQVVDHLAGRFEDAVAPVDLVVDTVGGERLRIGSSPWPTPTRRSSSAWATTRPARSSCASPTSRTVARGRSTSMVAAGQRAEAEPARVRAERSTRPTVRWAVGHLAPRQRAPMPGRRRNRAP
jgi:D-arabinose 1-dehydrogenase-like Zn-dependent alcohol dehydrogenase